MTCTARSTAVAATLASLWLLAATAAAAAEPPSAGGYLAVSGFFLGLTDTELRDVTAGGIERDLEADEGWGAGLALGYRSGRGLRLEGEASYRRNEADVTGGGPLPLRLEADVHAVALMGNVYFEPELPLPVNPYIGAGLGGANVAFDSDDLDIDDDDWVLAYQAIAGAVLKLGRAGVFAGYRYFATDDPVVRGTDVEYRTHNLEVGVRIGF